jgi:hypothetical protein
MTLNNLVGINLERIPVDLDAIKRLITANEINSRTVLHMAYEFCGL